LYGEAAAITPSDPDRSLTVAALIPAMDARMAKRGDHPE
jgi:hypothetical protein